MSEELLRIELNEEGIRELLQSPEVTGDLLARGQRIASAATAASISTGGGTFLVESEQTGERTRVVIVTADAPAMVAEATSRALTRALDAGR